LPVTTFRRNKIVATVGPASSSREMLLALMRAGADVFRLNFSHGQHAELTEIVAMIRELSRHRRQAVAILGDLQGPKIRTGMMRGDAMTLIDGQSVVVTTADVLGENGLIPTTYHALPQDVSCGDRILLAEFCSMTACLSYGLKRSQETKCIAVSWLVANLKIAKG